MSHEKYHSDEGRVTPVIVLKENDDGTFSARDVVGEPTGTVQDTNATIVAFDPSVTDADGGLKVHVQNPSTGGGGSVAGPVSIQDGTDATRKLAVDASGRIGINNLPATQPVSGSVSVSNFPATQPVSGTVTVSNPTANPETGLAKDATLTARLPSTLDADGGLKTHVQNFPATQTVSGSVSVSNFPATQPVSGTVTVSNPTANPETGLAKNLTLTDGTQKTQVTNFPATQAVSGTVGVSGNVDVTPAAPAANDYLPVRLTDGTAFYSATGGSGGAASSVTINDPTTTTQKLAVAADGSIKTNVQNFPATQAVSGTVAISGTVSTNTGLTQPLTDTQLRAAAVPVSGPLTDAQLRAAAVPVTGTFWQATQPVSIAGTVNVSNGQTQPLTDAQLRAAAVPVSIATIPTHAVTQSGTWSFAPAASTAATYTTETPLITPAAVGTAKEYLALMNPVGSTKQIQLRALWVMLSGVTLTAQEVWARRITAVVGGTAIVAAKNDTADAASVVTTLVHSPTSVTAALTTGLWQAHWVVGISGVASTAPAHAGDLPGSVVRFGMDGQKPPVFRAGEGLGISVVSRLGTNTGLIGVEWVEV